MTTTQMIYVVNSEQAAALRRGTVRIKHIAADQSPAASVYAGPRTVGIDYAGGAAVLCGTRVGHPQRLTDAQAGNFSQHLTCSRCEKRIKAVAPASQANERLRSRFEAVLHKCGAYYVRDNDHAQYHLPERAVGLYFRVQDTAAQVAAIMSAEWRDFLANPS